MIATTGQQLETARNITFQSFAHFDRVVFHHAHFQSRGTADNVFCFGCILYPRQLYDDAVEAGLLDDRLSHAQLIDAIMQSGDVLFHRIGAYFVNRFFGQCQRDVIAVGVQICLREKLTQLRHSFLYVSSVLHRYNQTVSNLTDGAGTDFFAAHLTTDVARITFKRFLHRGFHVHLHGEMHAAAQVQAQEHRVGTDFGHPFGTVRQQVERGDIAIAQSVFDDIAGFKLRFGIFETHFQRVVRNKYPVSLNTCLFQRGIDFGLGLFVNNDGLSVG